MTKTRLGHGGNHELLPRNILSGRSTMQCGSDYHWALQMNILIHSRRPSLNRGLFNLAYFVFQIFSFLLCQKEQQ